MPNCGGTECFKVREAFEFERAFRWWQPWRGLQLVAKRAGWCVVCLRCDTPYVVTEAETFFTHRALAKLEADGIPAMPPKLNGPREERQPPREVVRPRAIVP